MGAVVECWIVSLWGRCSVQYFPLSDDIYENIHSTSCSLLLPMTCSSRFGLGLSRTWNDWDRICSICSGGQRFGRCFSISKIVRLCLLVLRKQRCKWGWEINCWDREEWKDLNTCRHAEWSKCMDTHCMQCTSRCESRRVKLPLYK